MIFSTQLVAGEFNKYFIQDVRVCYDENEKLSLKSFFLQNCKTMPLGEVKLSNKLTWIGTTFDIDAPELIDKPIGLFFSAQAAAEFYFNGELIGRNGYPSSQPDEERPGVMDFVTYIPKGLLKQQNELVIKLSSHHKAFDISRSIGLAIVTYYDSPQDIVLRHYLPTLVPLGVLIIGFVFSSLLVLQDLSSRRNAFWLPLLSLLVALQLLTEVSRGFVAYEYPYHEIRLMVILLLGTLSGLSLLLYIIDGFVKNHRKSCFFLSMLLTFIFIYLGSTIEDKTVLAIQVPAGISFLITAFQVFNRQGNTRKHAGALFIFFIIIAVNPNQFLDLYFYYFVAALLLFFFVQHAIAYKHEQSQKQIAQQRADQLQQALDEYSEQQTPSKIKLNLSDKNELVSCDSICFVKGARDYVEICLIDERNVLHNETLTIMEKKLPATFLRIHRSYIVNKQFIQSLQKLPSGGGELTLSSGDIVPVSRRIMPKVRKQLM
ncbi:LytR/AlgR family response regulator transcription factor [Pseudoalteromonas umbrosa]|uniref:LytR/AlgR family response regulator transcription factor n=1 Tax=Pseudoalteromonas umbrosa TaxID=3048489 RepID=UPI0024C434DF|nr:LytTR family DNA-binding domain-containing protein [Pseudoalteromonas sp. B95]MDK1286818.1 LytTR family DNA-binding domain-containing protein [Pseudoalteromonas sp. B95]